MTAGWRPCSRWGSLCCAPAPRPDVQGLRGSKGCTISYQRQCIVVRVADVEEDGMSGPRECHSQHDARNDQKRLFLTKFVRSSEPLQLSTELHLFRSMMDGCRIWMRDASAKAATPAFRNKKPQEGIDFHPRTERARGAVSNSQMDWFRTVIPHDQRVQIICACARFSKKRESASDRIRHVEEACAGQCSRCARAFIVGRCMHLFGVIREGSLQRAPFISAAGVAF